MSALIYNTRVVDPEGSLLGELEIFEGEGDGCCEGFRPGA